MNEEIYINRRAIFPLSDVVNGYDSLYIIEVKGSTDKEAIIRTAMNQFDESTSTFDRFVREGSLTLIDERSSTYSIMVSTRFDW
jgi:hypothetical protein